MPAAVPRKKLPSLEREPFLQACVCECGKPDQDLVEEAPKRQGVAMLCQAIDIVGGHQVGCKNKSESAKLRRARPGMKGRVMCTQHVKRMKTHHMCGFCGEFCAHVSCLPRQKPSAAVKAFFTS